MKWQTPCTWLREHVQGVYLALEEESFLRGIYKSSENTHRNIGSAG